MDKTYLEDLKKLEEVTSSVPNTHLMSVGKILMLVQMNMRYENIMVNRKLDRHPYSIVQEYVRDALNFWKMWVEIGFIEEKASDSLAEKESEMEAKHKDLFQSLWVNFSREQYDERIANYEYRLDINDLGDGFLKNMRCIDFGCGHGNFAHALLRKGASFILGIDYGENSIKYANQAKEVLGVPDNELTFKLGSVYATEQEEESFDFAVQNGVFHHLDDEKKAYMEVFRVLKPGGWFWIYTTGQDSIASDLWKVSTNILQDVPHSLVIKLLSQLNISVGKRYHLGDALNATYRRSNWVDLTTRLRSYGFVNFRRMVGGFPTDFDHDVIDSDTYGKDKFGAGDLRVLAQKKI